MFCNCIARPLCPPASQCPRAVLEVSCRALVCPSAEAQWLWVLWSKCPCGFPLLCFLPFHVACIPLALVASPHPTWSTDAFSLLLHLLFMA